MCTISHIVRNSNTGSISFRESLQTVLFIHPRGEGGARVRWRARCARATIATIVDTALATIITNIHSGSYSYVSDLQSDTTGTIVPFSIIAYACVRVRACYLYRFSSLLKYTTHSCIFVCQMSIIQSV